MIYVRGRKFNVLVAVMVISLIVLSFNFQPYFNADQNITDELILSVDRDAMVISYLNDDSGCTEELELELDFLEVSSDVIFFRWVDVGSGVFVCGYDVDVLITTDLSWLVNFTIVVNNLKVLEEVSVVQPVTSADTSQLVIIMSEYHIIRIVDQVDTIIMILYLIAI